MVAESGGQYHILLLIADGQITCGAEVGSVQPTPQEVATAQALADASNLPMSIVVMGVGDGPWCGGAVTVPGDFCVVKCCCKHVGLSLSSIAAQMGYHEMGYHADADR